MAGRTLNWVGTTATSATASNWIDQATGLAPATGPDSGDDVRFGVGTGATNNPVTFSSSVQSLTIDNAYTGTFTLANTATSVSVQRGITLGTGATYASGGASAQFNLVGTTDNSGAGWSITTNGMTLIRPLVCNGAGGRWKIVDSLTTSMGAGALTVTAGTFDMNSKSPNFTSTSGGVVVNGGALIMGTGMWAFSTTNAVTFWNYSSGTVTGGGETISLIGTGTGVRTFAGGGQRYGTIRHDAASGTGALTVTGANTFTAIGNVTGRTVNLPASTTTTVNGANGLGGVKGTLNSSTSGTAATVNLTSTQVSVMRAATLKDITVTPNGHAYALDASVSTSGNTGITFNTPFGWGIAA